MDYEMWTHRGSRCQIELLPTGWDFDRCKLEAENSALLTNVTLVEIRDDKNRRVFACRSVSDDCVVAL